jgi:hypothetical protein
LTSPLTPLTNPNTIVSDGATVTATVWTNNFASITNYINNSLTASFNVVQNKGDIYCYDGVNIQALSASGVTNGWVLSKNSTASFGVQWISPPGLPTTTEGDMIYYTSGSNARLPIGTTGQVLTVSSGGDPAWQNAVGIPSGTIALWSGSITSIPSGWVICDGNNGTPNLQGLFLVGAGQTSPAATGGMGLMNAGGPFGDTSAGPGLGPTHGHSLGGAQTGNGFLNGPFTFTGAPLNGANSGAITPRYYSLAYMMKL